MFGVSAGLGGVRSQRADDGADGEVVVGVGGRAVVVLHLDIREIGVACVGDGVVIHDIIARVDVIDSAISRVVGSFHQLDGGRNQIDGRVIGVADIVAGQVCAIAVGGIGRDGRRVGHISRNRARGGACARSARSQRPADGADGEVIGRVGGGAVVVHHRDIFEVSFACIGIGVGERYALRAFDVFDLAIGGIASGFDELDAGQGIAEIGVVIVHDGIAHVDKTRLFAIINIIGKIAGVDIAFQSAAWIEVAVIDFHPVGIAIGSDVDKIIPAVLCAGCVAIVARCQRGDKRVVCARLKRTVHVIQIEIDHDAIDAGGAPFGALILDAVDIAVMPDKVAKGGCALGGVGIGVAHCHLREQGQRQHACYDQQGAESEAMVGTAFHCVRTPFLGKSGE